MHLEIIFNRQFFCKVKYLRRWQKDDVTLACIKIVNFYEYSKRWDFQIPSTSGRIVMDQFRARLLSVSNGITNDELGQLKFVCKQHIPVGVLEKIARPLELFDELENRNLLSEGNTELLAELLSEINRFDLKEELHGVKG